MQNTLVDSEESFSKKINHLTIDYCLDYNNVHLHKPEKLGCYSIQIDNITKERVYVKGRQFIKYLSIPLHGNINLDLKKGYSPDYKGINSDGLEELLHWIVDNKDKFDENFNINTNLGIDFVCIRGIIVKIMVTPYEINEDWLLYATKFNGTIYICQSWTDAKKIKEENQSDYQKKLCYSGRRFEHYICIGSEEAKDNLENQFCYVFKSRVKNHSFLAVAEIDCVETKKEINYPLDELNLIEVKTSFIIDSKKAYDSFCKYKSLKWWAQSYVAGVNTIVCGYRNNNLVVKQIEKLSLDSILSKGKSYWSSNICINFLDKFFHFVKDCVSQENKVYKFYCSPKQNITCTQVSSSEKQVLPNWYINSFKKS